MKTLILGLLISSSAATFAQKTDFSGNYKVNEEKVNWGPAPKYILPRYIKVQQTKDEIIISRTPLNQELQEQTPTIDTLKFDGKTQTKLSKNGSSYSYQLSWKDNKTFTLIRKSLNPQGELSSTTTETWNLEEEGKTLFIDREVDGRIKYNTKAYFDKIK